MSLKSVKIIGSGLIGTSIGLALRAKGVEVSMVDSDGLAEKLAQDLVGRSQAGQPDLVIVATPISSVSAIVSSEYRANPEVRVMDISSVKNKVKVDIESLGVNLANFLPSHPMAGREVGGAHSARADLFEGRAWIIDSTGVDRQLLLDATSLIELAGATAFDMPALEHDRAVALISHLPQLISSLMAKQLEAATEPVLGLAGAGLRDTVRIAGSDPKLWREIIAANAPSIKPLLQNFSKDLISLIEGLEDGEVIEKLIDSGRKGRDRIPGKHGGKPRDYTLLPIVIEDQPGRLAALFEECAIAKVNVEDLTIEHSPGQFTGLITLSLSQEDAATLEDHLSQHGWNVHSARK